MQAGGREGGRSCPSCEVGGRQEGSAGREKESVRAHGGLGAWGPGGLGLKKGTAGTWATCSICGPLHGEPGSWHSPTRSALLKAASVLACSLQVSNTKRQASSQTYHGPRSISCYVKTKVTPGPARHLAAEVFWDFFS